MSDINKISLIEKLAWKFPRGPKNAIIDVNDVKVGHLTVSRDTFGRSGQKIPIRTGVTAVLPSGLEDDRRFFFGFSSFKNRSDFTGYAVAEDFAYLNSPIVLANPYDTGTVYNAVLSCGFLIGRSEIWPPVVLSVDDSYLNGSDGATIKDSDVIRLIKNVSDRTIEEGSIGIGSGLKAYDSKGGIGLSSRIIAFGGKQFTIGTLVASNCGNSRRANNGDSSPKEGEFESQGSLTMILATDIPLLPYQIRQVTAGIILSLPPFETTRSQGDAKVCLLFTTANSVSWKETELKKMELRAIDDSALDGITIAGSESVKEAVLRSLSLAVSIKGNLNRRLDPISEDSFALVLESFAKTL
ncbi:MAG: P1 family peptidase [Candidatus Aminicenantes bacterium]|nr:P1 family peptidase [Candidatus Aminicenantes bacterium]